MNFDIPFATDENNDATCLGCGASLFTTESSEGFVPVPHTPVDCIRELRKRIDQLEDDQSIGIHLPKISVGVERLRR